MTRGENVTLSIGLKGKLRGCTLVALHSSELRCRKSATLTDDVVRPWSRIEDTFAHSSPN